MTQKFSEYGLRNSKRVRLDTIKFIKEILERHKNIKIEDIVSVGFIETGEFQYKVNNEIRDRQVITLLAYLCWFYDIKSNEIYG